MHAYVYILIHPRFAAVPWSKAMPHSPQLFVMRMHSLVNPSDFINDMLILKWKYTNTNLVVYNIRKKKLVT